MIQLLFRGFTKTLDWWNLVPLLKFQKGSGIHLWVYVWKHVLSRYSARVHGTFVGGHLACPPQNWIVGMAGAHWSWLSESSMAFCKTLVARSQKNDRLDYSLDIVLYQQVFERLTLSHLSNHLRSYPPSTHPSDSAGTRAPRGEAGSSRGANEMQLL